MRKIRLLEFVKLKIWSFTNDYQKGSVPQSVLNLVSCKYTKKCKEVFNYNKLSILCPTICYQIKRQLCNHAS